MTSATAHAAVFGLPLLLALGLVATSDAADENVAVAARHVPRMDAHARQAGDGADAGARADGRRVYLRSITALTFSENGLTRGRRMFPRTQLECVGGSAAGFFWVGADRYPRIVDCENRGWDGASVQWRCRAELKVGLEFGDTTVVCEGFAAPDDDYIVRGSCRLEYLLNYSSAYEISSAHVVYASVLAIALLWFYYQTRFYLHSRMHLVLGAVDSGLDPASSSLHPYHPLPSAVAKLQPPTGHPVTGGSPLM
jgi:SOCE-associated regulatory factor of calcium homoeostasis